MRIIEKGDSALEALIEHGPADHTAVQLAGSAHELKPMDLIAGMTVDKVTFGAHRGMDAANITLRGLDTGREIGRLVVIDAYGKHDTEGCVEWTRFVPNAELEDFKANIDTPVPPGYVHKHARAIIFADQLFIRGDYWRVESATLKVVTDDPDVPSQIGVELRLVDDENHSTIKVLDSDAVVACKNAA